MRILGIDPGFAIMGYGVIDYFKNKIEVLEYGVIKTQAKTPFDLRLLQNYRGINEVIEKYKPEHVAMEQLFFNTNQKTAIMYVRQEVLLCWLLPRTDWSFLSIHLFR